MKLNLLYSLLFIFIIIFIVCPKILNYTFLLGFTYVCLYTEDFVSIINTVFVLEEDIKKIESINEFKPKFVESATYKGSVETNKYNPDIQTPDLLNPFTNYSSDDRFSRMIQSKNDPNLRYKRPDYRKLVNEELNESETYPWWSKNEW
jgi:hypothetical protein